MSDTMRVVVIGGNATGAKAASRIRRLNPETHITMLEKGRNISFAGCGLPYHVSGKVSEIDALVKTPYGLARDEEFFRNQKNISVYTRCCVEEIDRDAKSVHARFLESNEAKTFEYDKLILAMGAQPIAPPVEKIDLNGVYHLTSMEDAAALAAITKEKSGGSAIIIGAGFIGMEATEALAECKWDVTVIERCDQVFPWALDAEIAALVQDQLFESMVEVELNCEIVRLEGNAAGHVEKVITKGDSFDADLVILATGVRPNVDLARKAGLTIGETGALAVDQHLRTSDPDIYAGGDLIENVHLVSKKKCYVPLGSTANKHGRIIADNICGLETPFPGILGTFICKVFDINVGSTGLSEKAAAEAGIDAYSLCAPGFDKAHYYPGSKMLGIKLVIEKGSQRLLGMQAAGAGDVARRIDIAATAIQFGASIDQLAELDLCYAPPYAQAMDCLITAANAAQNISAGLLKPIDATQTRTMSEQADDVVLLDVRSTNEFAREHIDQQHVINIPLNELPSRFNELPRDRKIICICSAGLRGYSAQRMLEAAGFEDAVTLTGGMFLWPWKDELA